MKWHEKLAALVVAVITLKTLLVAFGAASNEVLIALFALGWVFPLRIGK